MHLFTSLGISTYYRQCPNCEMVYRYQEWSDGIHNFNDHILLSLHLCMFLRNSIQVCHNPNALFSYEFFKLLGFFFSFIHSMYFFNLFNSRIVQQ